MKNAIVSVFLFVSFNANSTPLTASDNVASPIVAATNSQLKSTSLDSAMTDAWLDAPMSATGSGYFIATHSADASLHPEPDSLRHVMTSGYTNPYASEIWVKHTCQRNGQNYCINQTSGSYAFTSFAAGLSDVVNLWFASVYNPGGTERLAFVHEENATYTGLVSGNWEGHTRIGLAYSADSGNTWKYLGRIASPYSEPQPWNIQGAPYMIVSGTFYVWYRDYNGTGGGYAVSKANVASVLAAARAGNLGTNLWQKKTPAGWSTNIADQPAFPAGSQAEGIVHSQIAHSTTDGNYYLVTTSMTGTPWTSPNTYVELFTVDPTSLAWTHVLNVVSEPTASFDSSYGGKGYQYASLVDPLGAANGDVGSSFYVYSGKFKSSTPPYVQGLYQWQVNVSTPANFYKESRTYSSVPGAGYWSYAQIYSGALMTWNGVWWQQPGDQFNRILSGGMSTGTNDSFLLIWTAPTTGNITIRQAVRSSQPTSGCGDGVDIAFQKNGSVLLSGHIAWDDTIGIGTSLNIPITAGDHLYFYGTKGTNNYCDGLYWDPSIQYN